MIASVKAVQHTTATNLEDIGFRLRVDDGIIVPTKADPAQGARYWIYFPAAGTVMDLKMSYPVAEQGRLGIELYDAPGNGVQVIVGYQPMPIERRGQKAVYRHKAEETERSGT
jgi:hypothetical protein